jgi:hypothetical protein
VGLALPRNTGVLTALATLTKLTMASGTGGVDFLAPLQILALRRLAQPQQQQQNKERFHLLPQHDRLTIAVQAPSRLEVFMAAIFLQKQASESKSTPNGAILLLEVIPHQDHFHIFRIPDFSPPIISG